MTESETLTGEALTFSTGVEFSVNSFDIRALAYWGTLVDYSGFSESPSRETVGVGLEFGLTFDLQRRP